MRLEFGETMNKKLRKLLREAVKEAINPMAILRFNTDVAAGRAANIPELQTSKMKERIKAALAGSNKPSEALTAELEAMGVPTQVARKIVSTFESEKAEGDEKADQLFTNLDKETRPSKPGSYVTPAARNRRN